MAICSKGNSESLNGGNLSTLLDISIINLYNTMEAVPLHYTSDRQMLILESVGCPLNYYQKMSCKITRKQFQASKSQSDISYGGIKSGAKIDYTEK